jgi:hypothetical protein
MMSIASWTETAEAQPSDRFPGSVQIDIQGERHQAFSLGGFTELLRIDADLMIAEASIQLLDQQLDVAAERLVEMETAQDACEERVTVLQTERTRLLERWTDENRLRLEVENRPMIGEPIAWILAAGATVVAVILGGAMIVGGV